MSDLVDRLRFYAKTPLYGDIPQEMFDLAADEIEKLRKSIDLLEEGATLLAREMKRVAEGGTMSEAVFADWERRTTEHYKGMTQ